MADLLTMPSRRPNPLGMIGDEDAPILNLNPAMTGAMPLPPMAPLPQVSSPDTDRVAALQADIAKRTTPAHPTTVLGKIGHTAANIGNVLGDIFAPAVMQNINGTQLGNRRKVQEDQSDLQDIQQRHDEESSRLATDATAAYTAARPDIEASKIQQKQRTAQNAVVQKLVAAGHTPQFDENGVLVDAPDDPESQAFKDRQGLTGYRQALTDFKSLQAENAGNKYVPGTPQYEEWHRKLQQADMRLQQGIASLGLRREGLNLHEDEFYNPQPTGTERKTGDLASSAVNQVRTMRQVIQSNPDIFGPGGGRANRIQQWLGSQSPDAARYQAAQTYLAEHSAGVFGGRGAYILQGLHKLTDEHNNPAALNSVLDEAESTAQHFVDAGQVHGRGKTGFAANGSTPPASSSTPAIKPGQKVTLRNGQTITVTKVHPDGSFE